MEIRQLTHFLAVARAGSLSAAANELGMAQSGISSSLAALERELEVSLVWRSPGRRSVELTTAGQALLSPAHGVLEAVAAARAAVTTTSSSRLHGRVRIATVTTPPKLSILGTLLDFQARHPGVEASTTSASSEDVLALVSSGQADLGIAAIGPGERVGLDVAPITASPLALMCSPGHRLAGKAELSAEDLLTERLLALPGVHRARRMLDAWLQRGGVAPARLRIIESDDQMAVLDMVGRGRGVTYGPAAFAGVVRAAGLVLVPLRDAPIWELSLITTLGGPRSGGAAALGSAYLAWCAATGSGAEA